MILKEALTNGINSLKSANIQAPVIEAGVILCHTLGCSRAYLYSHDDYELMIGEVEAYARMIDERVKGRPLQYITGSQEFMSLDFIVTPDVLIPRQDTEVLVEEVIHHVRCSRKDNPVILDIGTGSGSIAISLAHYINNCRVFAMDISKDALGVARINAQRCGVSERVVFITGNILKGPDSMESCLMPGNSGRSKDRPSFDVIVSNPPYIPTADIAGLELQVRDFEPHLALDGGIDGLEFYRSIVKAALDYVKPEGLIAFEVGVGQADDVAGLLEKGFQNIRIVKDLSGIDRVVTAVRIHF